MVNPFASVFAAADRSVPTVDDLTGRTLSTWTNSSPSQCKEAAACPSRHWLDKIASFPRVERKSLALGTACHAEAEAYLLDGTPPGPIVAAGLHKLPTPPVPPAFVELHFAIVDPDLPVPVIGKIDLLEPASNRITDHKTTSDFRYVKTPDELRYDPQALIYCIVAAPAFRGVDTALGTVFEKKRGDGVERYPMFRLDLSDEALGAGLSFRHVYYRTRLNPDSREAEVFITADELRRGWAETVRPSVLLQHDISKANDVRDVAFDLSRCSDYGGCHFKTLCAGLGRQTVGAASFFFAPDSKTGDRNVSLLDALNKGASAPNGSTDPNKNPLLAAINAERCNPLEARAETAGDPPVDVADGVEINERYAVDKYAEVGMSVEDFRDPDAAPTVNPPDGIADGVEFTPPDPAPKNTDPTVPPTFDLPDEFRGARLKSLRKPQLERLFALLRNIASASPAPLVKDHFKSMTRVAIRDDCEALIRTLTESGAEVPNTASLVDETWLFKAETPEASAEAVDAEDAHPTQAEDVAPAEPSRMLFVDCAPRRGSVTYLSELLRPLQVAAAAELSVVSYRVPQYKRGEDNVAARLEAGIRDGSIVLPAILVAETSLPATRIALEILLPLYLERSDQVVERLGW